MLVRLLGAVEVAHESDWRRAGPAKRSCVLAALALSPGKSLTQEALAHRVWGGDPPPSARGVVYSHIAHLRRLFSADSRVTLTRSGAGGYRLDLPPELVDVGRMRQLVRQARAQSESGDLSAAATSWQAAAGLWRGEPLLGLEGPWPERVRAMLRNEQVSVLEGRFDTELKLGRHSQVIAELSDVVENHPLNETLAGLLMVALYRDDRPAEALDRFTRLRTRLRDELGNDPTPSVSRLHQQILRQDPELRRSPDTTATMAATPVVVPVPAQLPADTARLFGRADEVEAVTSNVVGTERPATVVVTAVDGMGGVGKTTLAVHVAHRLAPRYPDGQLFIDLHGFSGETAAVEPVEALSRMLRALGVDPAAIPENMEDRAAAYRSALAGKRMLIVLDNAADEQQVLPLLPGATDSMVLVTSRRRLSGLDDARFVSLDVLSTDEAVDLFIGTTGDRDPTADRDTIAEIVRLCGRLPLAVRIAAARLRSRPHWTIETLRDRIAAEPTALSELEVGRRSAAATFAISYRELEPRQRDLFRLLGLVPGPWFTVDGVASLAAIGPSDAETILDELIEVNLVDVVEPGRYRLHDLLRLFTRQRARQELPDESRHRASRRLYTWYMHTTRAVDGLTDRRLTGLPVPRPPDGVVSTEFGSADEARAWFDREMPGIAAALMHANAVAGPTETVWLLGDRRSMFFRMTGGYPQWQAFVSLMLDAAQRAGDPAAESSFHLGLGWCRFGDGHLAEARAEMANAVRRAVDSGSPRIECIAAIGRAWAELAGGSLTEAIESARRAVTLSSTVGTRRSDAHGVLGAALYHSGRLREASEELARQQRFRQPHDPRVSWPDFNTLHNELGDTDLTLRLADPDREPAEPAVEVINQVNLGNAYFLRGDYAAAQRHAARAAELCEPTWGGGFEAVIGLARTAASLVDDPKAAITHARRAIDIARAGGAEPIAVEAEVLLVQALVNAGDPQAGVDTAIAVRDRCRERGFVNTANKTLIVLAPAQAMIGELDAAIDTAEHAVSGHLATGNRPAAIASHQIAAALLNRRGAPGDTDAAAEHEAAVDELADPAR